MKFNARRIVIFQSHSLHQRRAADLVMPDGARYQFTRKPDGSFTPPAGRYDALVKNADGSMDLTVQRSRAKYHFGVNGRIESFTDEYGNVIQYVYPVLALAGLRAAAGANGGDDCDKGGDPGGQCPPVPLSLEARQLRFVPASRNGQNLAKKGAAAPNVMDFI
jgi:hypothetical protein